MFATVRQRTFYPSIDGTELQLQLQLEPSAIKARDARIAWRLENVRTISRVCHSDCLSVRKDNVASPEKELTDGDALKKIN